MFCPNCGKEIPVGSKYCQFCGGKTTVVVEAEPVKEKKPKKKATVIIIIAVVLALAIAAALFFILSGNKNNAMKNIDELSKSVVRVECFNKAGDLYCTGSGVVVFDSDKVITNYHVISGDCYTVTVTSDDGQSASVTQVLGYDEDKDLALLQLETPTSIKPLPIGDSENLQRGDEVIAIGSPLGLLNTASTGIVSGFLEDGDINAIQTSASISSGSSGGALLNKKGELIGITYAGFEGGENLNLAIPAYEINSLEILDYPKLPSGFYNEIYHEIDLTELLATYDTLPKDFKVKTTGYVSTIAKTKEDDAEIAYIVANPSDVLGFTKIDEIEFGERTLSNNLKINRHLPYLSITLHKCYPYYLFGISTFPSSAYHTISRRKFSITIV